MCGTSHNLGKVNGALKLWGKILENRKGVAKCPKSIKERCGYHVKYKTIFYILPIFKLNKIGKKEILIFHKINFLKPNFLGQLSGAVVRQRTSAAHLRTTGVQSEFSRLAHSLPASYIK